MLSLLLGACSVPAGALTVWPETWAKLPSAFTGFAAMTLGFLAFGEIRRTKGRGIVAAAIGMLLGMVGMLAGPLVFSGIGQKYRQQWGREHTLANLESIGVALRSYHRRYDWYPMGGIISVTEDGDEIPMHGWQTALLPFLGDETFSVYRKIRFSQPYDSQINVLPMSTEVTQFYAAGASRSKLLVKRPGNVELKLAVTHYSGVGGELLDDEGGLLQLGIFGTNQRINRGDIIDGESQTLVAGEIKDRFPAWGAPNNWRGIQKGLNADYKGFGNSDGTGAMFLKADGSVKFFANSTSLQILKQLSTRDGNEYVADEFR